MIVYLIKSTICLAVLFAIYRFFLEKEKMHQFNRFYLLGILLFSLVVPSFVYIETAVVSPINTLAQATANSFSMLDYLGYILIIYGCVASILFIRFIRNVIEMITKISRNTKIKVAHATIVLLDEKILPHTFMRYIFINKEDYEAQRIEEELFTHELTHVTQKHTLDVLCVELFQIVFWFNPILRFVNKSIRLNHEFIADETVINAHENITNYQHILLDISTWNNTNCLSSNLNYSLTKKRFQMMVKRSSRITKLATKISLIPIGIMFVFLFANTVVSQENNGEEHAKPSIENAREEEHHDSERGEHASNRKISNEHAEESHNEGEDHE